jgi:hypothetical protein
MIHPDIDRLTAWVHELLEPEDVAPLAAHVSECADCREKSECLRREARVLAAEIAPKRRLADLKERLMRSAEKTSPPAASRRNRGLLWQIPLAAAVLVGLIAILASPGPRHSLVAGRVALEDGQEVAAPTDLTGLKSWRLQAVEKASVRLSDRTTVHLQPGSWIGLEARGERGVQAQLASGEAKFVVAPEPRRLTVCSPSGRVESNDGTFVMKIVVDDQGGTSMKGMIAGALVTVLAGSASLANAQGTASIGQGHAAVLATSEAPLLLASPQDADALLKRLEQLAARVAKLEDEIGRLETKNKQLKEQLKAGGGAWFGGPGGGVRVNLAPGSAAPGQPVIIEREDRNETTNPKKDK